MAKPAALRFYLAPEWRAASRAAIDDSPVMGRVANTNLDQETPMTDAMMSLKSLIEKAPDTDILREMISFAAERLMEVGALTGAAYGEKSPDRRGAEAVIPSKTDRKQPIPHDRDKYRWRHLIENYFCKIKEFRAVNTRYDKTDLSYKATITLAAIAIAPK